MVLVEGGNNEAGLSALQTAMTFYHEAGAAAYHDGVTPALMAHDFGKRDNLVFRMAVGGAGILNQGVSRNDIGVCAINLSCVHALLRLVKNI